MSRRPLLTRSGLSVGKLEGLTPMSAIHMHGGNDAQAGLEELSFPVRILEISTWNDAEWVLIPPVISNAVQEVRAGLQVVYDLFTGTNGNMKVVIADYTRLAERLDAYCIDFGKRIAALEMKLESGHLRQDSILQQLKYQQEDMAKHRTATQGELNAQFERMKLLLDSAIGRIDPLSDVEIDAIALRLVDNPTLTDLVHRQQVQQEEAHAKAIKAVDGRLSEIEEKLEWHRKNNKDMHEIIEANRTSLERYQARIGEKMRLFDETTLKVEQLVSVSSRKNTQSDADMNIKGMHNDIVALRQDLAQLRALVDEQTRTEEYSSINSQSQGPESALSVVGASNSTTPRNTLSVKSKIKSLPATAESRSRRLQSPHNAHSERATHATHTIPAHHARNTTGGLAHRQYNKHHHQQQQRQEHHSISRRLSNPSRSGSVTGQDEPEAYQGFHRDVVERVDPLRYKSTFVSPEEHAANKDRASHSLRSMPSPSSVQELLPQISAQLARDNRLIKVLCDRLFPDILAAAKDSAPDNHVSLSTEKVEELSQQVAHISEKLAKTVESVDVLASRVQAEGVSSIKALQDTTRTLQAALDPLSSRLTESLSKITSRVNLANEALQVSMSTQIKSLMDTMDHRDKLYVNHSELTNLSQQVADIKTRLNLYENIVVQIYRKCVAPCDNNRDSAPIKTFPEVVDALGLNSTQLYTSTVASAHSSMRSDASSSSVPTCVHTTTYENTNTNAAASVSVSASASIVAGATEISDEVQSVKRDASKENSRKIARVPPKSGSVQKDKRTLPGHSNLTSSHGSTPIPGSDPIAISPGLKVAYYDPQHK